MAKTSEQPPQDKYEYFRSLPLDGINEHLAELTGRFAQVQRYYSGPIGRFRKNLKVEDMTTLDKVIGDLLPMSTNTQVQHEALSDQPIEHPEDIAFNRIGTLQMDVLTFLAHFNNTGVTLLPSSYLD